MTFLIARVVEDQRDGIGQSLRRDAAQQIAHAVGVDVGVVRDQNQFVRHGVQGAQHIETLPRIDEKDHALPGLGLVQTWLELFFLKSSCASMSALAGIMPTLRHFIPILFKNARTRSGLRLTPVSFSIVAIASLTLAGGCSRK